MAGLNDIPETLGPYRFERRLGAGGMGEVYLAYDPRLDRRVAVKRFRSDLERSDLEHSDLAARLRREARAAARLRHPAIVQVFEFLEARESGWMVMEYVEGESLAETIRRGPMTWLRAVDYGRQIADGLAEAHDKGIVHRDLKAENVLVTAEGQVRILDFGLARDVEPSRDESSLTRSGVIVGTIRAMAPEHARGLEATPRSDLFSLGVLLYEMLAGRSPFLGESRSETLVRLFDRPPDPLPEHVPAKLAALVSQLLEKAPELRPESAGSVAARLRELGGEIAGAERSPLPAAMASTELTAAWPLPTPTPAAKAPPRRWSRHALSAVIVVAALALMAPFIFLEDLAGPASESPRRSPSESTPGIEEGLDAEAPEEEGWEALERFDLPGRTDRALELFQLAVDRNPGSAGAHAGLARAYWRQYLHDSGDRMWAEQAVAVSRRAVELDAEQVSALVSLGLALISSGEHEEARGVLERTLELDPENADAHRGLAEIHQAAGQSSEAEVAFRRAIELRPGDRELHDLLGAFYFREGRLDAAEAAFRRSLELAPDGMFGHQNLAAVLLSRGRLAEATQVLEAAIARQPMANLYLNLGTALYYQGRYAEAAEAYESALEFPVGANNYYAWANLGDAYRRIPHRRGEAPAAFLKAIRLLEPRVESQPRNGHLRSLLVLYRARAGQREEALQDMEPLRQPDARMLYRVVLAYEALGERERALEMLERAIGEGLPTTDVEREPELLDLRGDPRYHRLLAGLPKAYP